MFFGGNVYTARPRRVRHRKTSRSRTLNTPHFQHFIPDVFFFVDSSLPTREFVRSTVSSSPEWSTRGYLRTVRVKCTSRKLKCC